MRELGAAKDALASALAEHLKVLKEHALGSSNGSLLAERATNLEREGFKLSEKLREGEASLGQLRAKLDQLRGDLLAAKTTAAVELSRAERAEASLNEAKALLAAERARPLEVAVESVRAEGAAQRAEFGFLLQRLSGNDEALAQARAQNMLLEAEVRTRKTPGPREKNMLPSNSLSHTLCAWG